VVRVITAALVFWLGGLWLLNFGYIAVRGSWLHREPNTALLYLEIILCGGVVLFGLWQLIAAWKRAAQGKQ